MNTETIAINQDTLGAAAFRFSHSSDPLIQQWGRHLANGDMAALLLNRHDNHTVTATLHFSDLNSTVHTSFVVRDVQAKKDLGVVCYNISFELQPHQTAFVRLKPAKAAPCLN